MTDNIVQTIDAINEPTKLILTTMTEVKLNKKDKSKELSNTIGTVFKLQSTLVEVNVNYEDKVNQLLLENGNEPNFKSSGELPWGVHVDEHWVEHKGLRYLKVIELDKIGDSAYVTKDTNDDLIPIERSEFEPFLPASSPKKETTEEVKVKFRMYQLPSIINIEPYETTT